VLEKVHCFFVFLTIHSVRVSLAQLGSISKIRTIDIGGVALKLQIWDTAGQERFRTMTSSYYRGAQGVVIVYDITEPESFANVKKWLKEIEISACENVNKLLVGNKSDLSSDRKIKTEEGRDFAEKMNLQFLETSAKDASNVEDAFCKLAKSIKERLAVKKS